MPLEATDERALDARTVFATYHETLPPQVRVLVDRYARTGDAGAIAAYLGAGEAFDRAVARFAARYAGQNERDYERFVKSAR